MSANDYITGVNPATGQEVRVPCEIMSDGLVSIGKNEVKLSTVDAVDLNTATNQLLYTVPTGKTCVITRICQRNASISLTTNSHSIGWTSAAYADVVANATHTGLTGPTLAAWLVLIVAGIKMGTAGQPLYLKNNTNQGAAATASFDVFGILV
jgi:hypothetical protein